jgi:hypothetical protein
MIVAISQADISLNVLLSAVNFSTARFRSVWQTVDCPKSGSFLPAIFYSLPPSLSGMPGKFLSNRISSPVPLFS